jgi:hypothetical protein
MALSARIGRRSKIARGCKCPAGSKKVFVGEYGIRCGKVKKVGGRKRWSFVKMPKGCNTRARG